MKDIRTRSSGRTPRTLSHDARMPKELARRALLSAEAKAREIVERQPPDESPERYAEERVERTAEEMTHHVEQGGKQLLDREHGTKKQNSTA